MFMVDEVKIPKYFDISMIDSKNINSLFDSTNKTMGSKKNGNTVTIESLRLLYQKDREFFENLVLELSLRGFDFSQISNSNIFPRYHISKNPKLIHNNSKDIDLTKIDFELLRLTFFLNTFDVKSSSFFNNIPLEGFLSINNSINLQLLEVELTKAGFTIETFLESEPKVTNQQNNKNKNKNIRALKAVERLSNTAFIYMCRKKYLNSMLISEVLSPSSKYVKYLKKRGVESFKDFTNEKLYELYLGSSYSYKIIVHELTKCIAGPKLVPYLLKAYTSMCEQALPEISVRELFVDNKFNGIRKFCMYNKILTLVDLSPEKFKLFSQTKGIGIGKLIDVLDTISDIANYDPKFIPVKSNTKPLHDRKIYFSRYLSSENDWYKSFDQKNGVLTLNDIREVENNLVDRFGKKKKTKKIINDIDKSIEGLNHKRNFDAQDSFINLGIGLGITLEDLLGVLGISIDVDPKFESSISKRFYSLTLNQMLITEDFPNEVEEFNLLNINFFLCQLYTVISNNKYVSKNFDLIMREILSERDNKIYISRIVDGYTLEETGQIVDCTRERVRQIEKKIIEKMNNLIDFVVVPHIRLLFSKSSKPFLLKEEIDLSDSLLRAIIGEKGILSYDKDLEIFSLNSMNTQHMITELKKSLVSLPIGINYDEVHHRIINNNSLPQDLIRYFVENNKIIIDNLDYNIINGKIIPKKVTKEDMVVFTLNQISPNGLNVNNAKHLAQFREVYSLYFPDHHEYVESESVDNVDLGRKVRGILERSDKVIMKEPSTFMYYEFDRMKPAFLKDIYRDLKSIIHKQGVVSYKKIANRFLKELKAYNITPYMLYFILKYFYSSEFTFGKGNTMYIFSKKYEKMSTEDIIYNKVLSMGGVAEKEQISTDMGFEMYTIDQAISKSNQLISNGTIVCINRKIHNNISKKMESKLRDVAEDYLSKNSFIPLKVMYNDLKFANEYSKEMTDSGINCEKDLGLAVRSFMTNLKVRGSFLFDEEKAFDGFEELLTALKAKRDPIFSREDFMYEADKIGFTVGTSNGYYARAKSNGIIVEINEDSYTFPEFIETSDTILSSVKEYLEDQIKEKMFISLRKLKGYRRALPRIMKYRWTPELLWYYVKVLKFGAIDINENIYRNPLIIVNPLSGIKSYQQLLVQIMNEYRGNMHKSNVLEYLVTSGVVATVKENMNSIPRYVLNLGVIKVNNIDIVERVDR